MKFAHIGDLHIGKRVHDFSMLEDQRYILKEILRIIDEERPDAVLISGDVYDKAVPSAEAVLVLDEFLCRLAQCKLPVLMISGNHDSAERVAFGGRLMERSGVYVSPVYDGAVQPIVLHDAWGEMRIYLLPFLKPAHVRRCFPDETIESYTDALRVAVGQMEIDAGARNLLLTHQFVTGAARCESEELSVGGADHVDASVFDGFDYVALGHLHGPQSVGGEHIRYCGSPLKYSFSEAGQQKSATVVELLEKGNLKIREIPLKPQRDMRKLKGTYMEITSLSGYQDTNTEDYVQITLTDEEDIVNGMQKLRTIYPNLMRLEYDNRRTRENQEIAGTETVKRKSELEYFEEFFELQNNQPMNEEQRKYSEDLIRKIQEGK